MLRLAPTLLLLPLFAGLAAPAGRHAVYKSTDRGRSWVRSDTGMPEGARINAFASLDGTLFAGTDSGLYSSRNEARSWRPATGVAMSSGRIISFATLERRVFAGTAGDGLFVSTDGGESWALSAGFPSRSVRCLLAHQGRLYAGTDAEGVVVSEEGGQVWTPLQQKFPAHAQVFALAVVEDRLFAALYSKGLYAWNEPDQRWERAGRVSPLVLAGIQGTLVAGHNPGGLYWSSDLGATWSKGTAATIGPFPWELSWDAGELSSEAAVWELASNDELVMTGAAAGIFYSEDHGRTWVRARAGLPQESPGISFLLEDTFVLAGITIQAADGEPDSPATGSRPIR